MEYNFTAIEKKWQDYWEENKTFKTKDDLSNPKKFYALDMFPYPSGSGLRQNGHMVSNSVAVQSGADPM